jgi:hypothetical protein
MPLKSDSIGPSSLPIKPKAGLSGHRPLYLIASFLIKSLVCCRESGSRKQVPPRKFENAIRKAE